MEFLTEKRGVVRKQDSALQYSGCKRTQVTQKAVLPKGSLTLLQDVVYGQCCFIPFKRPFLSAHACSFQHKLLAG